jgi:methylmalonyl-CoA mutase
VYQSEAPGAAKALAATGAVIHLAGRPGNNEQGWRQAGVKDFIYMGCDALSTLRAVHGILGVK